MAKIGVGVGEEFPVEEPPPPPPPPSEEERKRMERRWRWHRWLHLDRAAVLALIVAGIVWMFTGPHHAGSDWARGFHPHPHHFFFPFFPIFLLLVFAFAWRRGCGWDRGWHDHHHHHDHYGDSRGGA